MDIAEGDRLGPFAISIPDFRPSMSRLVRALVLGSLGAAVSGVALSALRPRTQAPPKPLPSPREVEADALSDAESDALLRELARDLDV